MALLIGNSNYEGLTLAPVSEFDRVEAALKAAGFAIKRVENLKGEVQKKTRKILFAVCRPICGVVLLHRAWGLRNGWVSIITCDPLAK